QAQKDLIADAFKSYFADSTTTKSLTNFTDSINPFINGQTILLKNGATATIVAPTQTAALSGQQQQLGNGGLGSFQTDPGAVKPTFTAAFAKAEITGATGDKLDIDSVGGVITYTGGTAPAYTPTATVVLASAVFAGHGPAGALEQADIKAVSDII